jgi:hypothetical protein
MAVTSEVGNGCTTLFWKDRWMCGHCMANLAPHLLAMVPARIALTYFRWTRDMHGVLTASVLGDILVLADLLASVTLQQDQSDRHVCRLSVSRKYSAKSAYGVAFQGSISFDSYDHIFDSYDHIWKSWAPPKCSFFLRLVAHNHCWTADRLERRNLPHPSLCLLCD